MLWTWISVTESGNLVVSGPIHGGGGRLAFKSDSPPSRSGPKASRGGRAGGIGGGGSRRGDTGGAVGWSAGGGYWWGGLGWWVGGQGGGGHHCSPFWTRTLTLTRAFGET